MDQGLKERLIGAAVLVLVGVLVIPWILDGRGAQQETSATALRLPALDEPVQVRTETIHVGGRPEAEPAAPAPAPIAELADERQLAAADLARQPAEPPAATLSASPLPAASTAALPHAADERTASTQSQAAAPASTPSKSAAPVSSARPAPKGAWTVQLGSFGDNDNAKKLAQRVNTYGYKPAVSSHKSGARVLYRVRVGAYDKRSDADATASSLSAHGFVAQVVAAD